MSRGSYLTQKELGKDKNAATIKYLEGLVKGMGERSYGKDKFMEYADKIGLSPQIIANYEKVTAETPFDRTL